MSQIFITGSTGFIGGYLVTELLNEGHVIKALIRDRRRAVAFENKSNFIPIIGDLSQLNGDLREAIKGTEIFINLAGVVTDWARYERYHGVHIAGTRQLLELGRSIGIKRFVQLSTIDVLDKKRLPLVEDGPYKNSGGHYEMTKAAAERHVLSAARSHWFEVSVLRPSWVYGIGDKTLFPEIAFQLERKKMVFVHSKDVQIPLVHVRGVTWALKELAINPIAANQVYNINDVTLTWGELLDYVADKLGHPRPKMILPFGIAYCLAFCMESWGKIINSSRRPVLTKTAVEMLGRSVQINTDKIKRELHYVSPITIEEGLSEVINWLRSHDVKALRVK